jgi:hypothetical protein
VAGARALGHAGTYVRLIFYLDLKLVCGVPDLQGTVNVGSGNVSHNAGTGTRARENFDCPWDLGDGEPTTLAIVDDRETRDGLAAILTTQLVSLLESSFQEK